MKILDPVCTMMVDTEETIIKSEYEGQMYYFCAPGCKSLFEKYPERYAKLLARIQGAFDESRSAQVRWRARPAEGQSS